jgi:S-adenosylmethionine:tRNA ribosyltransferase-isomerase
MDNLMQTYKQISMDSFDYPLPDERIAKYPKSDREMSKLLLYKKGDIVETKFTNAVEEFAGNELLVFNNTKVIHARLFFRKTTGALIEIFCLEPNLQ